MNIPAEYQLKQRVGIPGTSILDIDCIQKDFKHKVKILEQTYAVRLEPIKEEISENESIYLLETETEEDSFGRKTDNE
ncbi:hypothetical protein GIB67_026222 [Kingdonia uniflora]|uniref:Uncharacterized protein n=1 Tax=Kingdonia uniflora TaxID=39325 RepID=A0A7J7LA18_9MAGN|nr:hypothetical protein GIB67_026222 [Kingdonia uniflora]